MLQREANTKVTALLSPRSRVSTLKAGHLVSRHILGATDGNNDRIITLAHPRKGVQQKGPSAVHAYKESLSTGELPCSRAEAPACENPGRRRIAKAVILIVPGAFARKHRTSIAE